MFYVFFFSSRRRHTSLQGDWSSDVCSSDLKVTLAQQLWHDWQADQLVVCEIPLTLSLQAGQPQRPALVPPNQLVRRRLRSRTGQAALIHAVAHIEFNAINLACDAASRFQGLPAAYYADWVRVAAEEAKHFALLQAR